MITCRVVAAVLSDSRAALWLVALLARSSASKDAVLPVPHHEVSILRRTIAKPPLDWADRAVLAALCRLVPDAVRSYRLGTPDTLLRRDRRLVAKNCTYPHRTAHSSMR